MERKVIAVPNKEGGITKILYEMAESYFGRRFKATHAKLLLPNYALQELSKEFGKNINLNKFEELYLETSFGTLEVVETDECIIAII